ncbi:MULTISPECIES: glycosyltransferase family 2 protein [Bacillus cereus group]|uniref:glycosyltransferase family 2 protein n=1 Tax=Bacillus cereus group TaxID=86661 RepID=UPI0001A09B8E|nr:MULTISPECIES: glycosyltransferase [Bacillus cereus group]EEL48453.1 hypothetical protein bcere0022_43160 [Bacillus cereus Rock3-44]PFO80439.1 glycosyl transferase [Bacillus cereus]
MEKPLISLLVAVYKTEEYLEKCLNSLANQSLNNIEIIVVNDGSPDNSQKIIDRYVKGDTRFKSIKQDNSGLGATRNTGINKASGKYIAFIDSDDWIEPDYCLKMYEEAISKDADVVITDYYLEINKGSRNKSIVAKATEKYNFDKKREYVSDILKKRISGFSWNKLYKLSLINQNNLRFPVREELENVEDQYFSIRSIFFAKNISFVHAPLYHYNIHDSSIVQRYQKNLFMDGLNLYELNCNFFKECNCYDEWIDELFVSLLNHSYGSILNEGKSNNPHNLKERLRCIRKICSNEKLQQSFRKLDIGIYENKKKILLLLMKQRLTSITLLYSTIYQRVIEYKMKK